MDSGGAISFSKDKTTIFQIQVKSINAKIQII